MLPGIPFVSLISAFLRVIGRGPARRENIMKTLIILFVAIAAPAQHQAIPPELVGTWSYTETAATVFRDRATGGFARPSGSSSTVELHADGSFKN